MGKFWEALGELLREQPAAAFLVISLVFEGPAVAYMAREGTFTQLLIVGALALGNATVYYVLRKTGL